MSQAFISSVFPDVEISDPTEYNKDGRMLLKGKRDNTLQQTTLPKIRWLVNMLSVCSLFTTSSDSDSAHCTQTQLHARSCLALLVFLVFNHTNTVGKNCYRTI